MATAVPGAPKRHHLYFVNAWVDAAVIGGVSVVLFLVLFAISRLGSEGVAGQVTARSPFVLTLAAWLAWGINWPHFSATSYRLYHSKGNIAQYPFTAFAVPVLLLAATWASFAYPDAVAPFFVKLFLIWSPYHFSGQSVGISLIYARRAGFVVGKAQRLALSGFIFGTYIYQTSLFESQPHGYSYYNISVTPLGLPAWAPTVAQIGMYLSGAAFLVFVAAWCVRNRRMLPPIVLLPAITQFIWFVPGSSIASFNEFVPMFHSLQYLLIAWSMQLKEKMDENGIAPSGGYVGRETARWGVVNIAGGVALFYILPRLAASTGFPLGFAEPVILSAVQIHHFFVDGVIWKLKNPKVSSPLLVNIGDILRPAPQPARAPA